MHAQKNRSEEVAKVAAEWPRKTKGTHYYEPSFDAPISTAAPVGMSSPPETFGHSPGPAF